MNRDWNEQKLQAIINGSNLASWQWNVQTGDTVFNEHWAQIVGYTLEELAPTSIETWNRLLHPEDSKLSEEVLKQHFAGESPFYDLEVRMKHKDGSWVWVHDRGKVIDWTEDGRPLMMFGTHADITERKNEEQENRRRLDQYTKLQRFFQLSSDLMIIMDPEGKTWKANRSWHTMLGYEEDEICQIPQISLIHPDDLPITAETIGEFTSQAGSRHISRIRHKDGSYRSIDWQIQSQDDWLYATGRDISKEYELEKQIEGFLDFNLDLLCVADLDGNFHKINKRFQDALGYSDQELNGTSFLALVHEDDLESTRKVLEDLASRKGVNGFVNRFRCKDGSYRYLEWVSQPAVGNYIYASARDVTEKHLAEEELRKTAITDELTGLFNRHYFENIIVEKIRHADRSGEPLSMLLLDLDHFKQVNDTFGHPVGDELLRHVAQTMLRSIRDTDILVRFGGEEFAILLPKTNLEGALAAAEKIRRAIEEQPLPSVGVRTASLGVAERIGAESFRHWYRRLDGALYLAKKLGRNRAVASDGTEALPLNATGLSWKRKWESGNKLIDGQHKELIAIGNRLLQLYESQEQPEELLQEVERLLHHTAAHFTAEAKVLEVLGFPGLETHKEEHADLLHKALELKQAYDQGEVSAIAFFSFLLDDVILGHLMEKDVLFFDLTREKQE